VFFVAIIIRATGNDTTDSLIRKFQKKIVTEKVIQEYRELDFYKKKSELRQERRKEKMRKIRRAKRLAAL
jgi:ribosomal protein S21